MNTDLLSVWRADVPEVATPEAERSPATSDKTSPGPVLTRLQQPAAAVSHGRMLKAAVRFSGGGGPEEILVSLQFRHAQAPALTATKNLQEKGGATPPVTRNTYSYTIGR